MWVWKYWKLNWNIQCWRKSKTSANNISSGVREKKQASQNQKNGIFKKEKPNFRFSMILSLR